MVTRPVMASMAMVMRLNWRIVVIVTSGWRQSKNGRIATMAFVVLRCVLDRPNGTTKAKCIPLQFQFWRRYCIPKRFLCQTTLDKGIQTRTYQLQARHKTVAEL